MSCILLVSVHTKINNCEKVIQYLLSYKEVQPLKTDTIYIHIRMHNCAVKWGVFLPKQSQKFRFILYMMDIDYKKFRSILHKMDLDFFFVFILWNGETCHSLTKYHKEQEGPEALNCSPEYTGQSPTFNFEI